MTEISSRVSDDCIQKVSSLSFWLSHHLYTAVSLQYREGSKSTTKNRYAHKQGIFSLPPAECLYFVLLSLKACVYIILTKRGQ